MGSYVDFGTLLPKLDLSADNSSKKLSINADGDAVIKAEQSSQKISDIGSWTDAFFVYCSIFLATHPHRTQELLKYGRDVRLAAKKYAGLGWRDYDQMFKMRLALDPSHISFATIDYELWLTCMGPSLSALANVGRPVSSKCNT